MSNSIDEKASNKNKNYFSKTLENFYSNGYFGDKGKSVIASDSFSSGTSAFYAILGSTSDIATNRKISQIGTAVSVVVSGVALPGSNSIGCSVAGIIVGTTGGATITCVSALFGIPLVVGAPLGSVLGSNLERFFYGSM